MSTLLNPYMLLTFNLVYELRNFTKVANVNAMTQAGVSHHIAQLEMLLNVRLFERNNKKITPTEMGHELYRYSKASLNEMKDFIESTRSLNLERKVKLTMASAGEFGKFLLENLISISKEESLEFSLKYTTYQDIYNLLNQGEIDIGFVDKIDTSFKHNYEKILDDELILIANSSKGSKINKKNLFDYSFVGHPNANNYLTLWLGSVYNDNPEVMKKAHFKHFINNMEGIAAITSSGQGITVLPRIILKTFDKKYRLSEVKGFSKVSYPMYMIYREDLVKTYRYDFFRRKILNKII